MCLLNLWCCCKPVYSAARACGKQHHLIMSLKSAAVLQPRTKSRHKANLVPAQPVD